MARKSVKLPDYVDRLYMALMKKMPGAQIDYEKVLRDYYRFIVVWQKFGRMGHPERQALVWTVADEVLSKPEMLKVSMIITMSPKELPPGMWAELKAELLAK